MRSDWEVLPAVLGRLAYSPSTDFKPHKNTDTTGRCQQPDQLRVFSKTQVCLSAPFQAPLRPSRAGSAWPVRVPQDVVIQKDHQAGLETPQLCQHILRLTVAKGPSEMGGNRTEGTVIGAGRGWPAGLVVRYLRGARKSCVTREWTTDPPPAAPDRRLQLSLPQIMQQSGPDRLGLPQHHAVGMFDRLIRQHRGMDSPSTTGTPVRESDQQSGRPALPDGSWP